MVRWRVIKEVFFFWRGNFSCSLDRKRFWGKKVRSTAALKGRANFLA